MTNVFLALLLVIMLITSGSCQMIWHGDKESKVIYLTFDDGPDFSTTPKLLRILRETGVKATFLWLEERSRSIPV